MAASKMMLALFISTVIMFLSVHADDSILERFFLDHQALASAPTPSGDSHLTGAEAQIAGVDAYVSGSKSSKRAVLLSSDVWGYKVENLRKIADKAAGAGYLAVVPDFFNGDPYDGNRSHLLEWKKIHDTSVSAAAALRIVKALKSQHRRLTSFGAAGFCFGAKIATELAKAEEVKAIVLLHPTDINATDIEGVEKPIAIFLGEKDNSVNATVRGVYEQILKAKKVPSLVKIYAGAAHGWTTRYNESDPAAVELADGTHRDLLRWFRKYVK